MFSLRKKHLSFTYVFILFLSSPYKQGVRFDPDQPQTIRLEFAKSNTKVTKPKQTSPLPTQPGVGQQLTPRDPCKCDVKPGSYSIGSFRNKGFLFAFDLNRTLIKNRTAINSSFALWSNSCLVLYSIQTISLISKMMHCGTEKDEICALDLPIMHHFGD